MKVLSVTPLAEATIGELVGEIRRRCRRRGARARIRCGDLVVDVGVGEATWRGMVARLSPRETDVLVTLAGAAPDGLTAWELADAIWGPDASPVGARVYVRDLRRKLPGLIPILTARGVRVPYRLAVAS